MSESKTQDAQDLRLNKRLKDTPIAIVGMASLFANSRYLNDFWDLICDKIDAITEVPADRWQIDDYFDADKRSPDKSYCKRGGFIPQVDFNPMEFGLPPNILELTDSAQLLSLIVAKEVLEDAGVSESSAHDRDKIGITLGIGGGQKISQSLNARLQYPVLKKVFRESGISDADSEMLIRKFQDQYIHWEENSFPGSLGNVIAGRIANRFDLGGMNCVVDAACAGSLAAIRMALTELTEGRADMMLTGGACTDNSAYMYMSFSKTPAFTVDEQIKPFDADSKGMMIGEGIGMVALKRLDDAERDGDKIYAVIKGVGASSDGKFKSIYAPRPEGQAKALRRAYDDAGFPAHTLGLMEAHGTGTAAGDVAEFSGLSLVMGESSDETQHIALGSIKSQVGHTKSTAGTAGLIKAALALHHKVLPPTINVNKPNPKLNIEASPFYLSTETRPWLPRPDGTPRRAAVSSFGFGGTNFHLVMEEYQRDHDRKPYRLRATQLPLLFAAATREALSNELKTLCERLSTSEETFETLTAPFILKGEAPKAEWPRLGIVAGDAKALKACLEDAITRLATPSDDWHTPDMSFRAQAMAKKAKVAALFAGQGSQYLGMGGELAMLYPEMRAEFIAADEVFHQRGYPGRHGTGELSSHVFPIPKFDAGARKQDEAALTNTRIAQSAIGVVSMGQFEILKAAGLTPDAVAGHSFGELSALRAAGVIDQASYYRLAFARGDAMASVPEGKDAGTMAAVILPDASHRSTLDTLLAQHGSVVIANHNSPTQLVLAGPTDAVNQLVQALADKGIRAIALPVSGAFHTPLVGHAHAPFAKAIDKETFSDASAVLYANASGDKRPTDGKSLKQSLKAQMLEQVQFESQIESLYRDGVRIFIEFGPKNTLSRLVDAILGERAKECLILSLDAQAALSQGRADSKLKLAAVELATAGFAITNPDPYREHLSHKAMPKSPLTVKLSASNYLSPATAARMQASLKDGQVSKQTQIVEKIVEKTQYIPQANPVQPTAAALASNASHPAQGAASPVAPTQVADAPVTATGTLEALFAAQQQLAALHQQFLTIPAQYGEGVQALMQKQLELASAGLPVPAATERALELFHQHQADTLKIHSDFMRAQAIGSEQMLSALSGQTLVSQTPAATVTPASAPVYSASLAKPVTAAAPVTAATVTPAPVAQAPVAPAASAPAAQAVAAKAATTAASQIQDIMLQVVAAKTGYPTEMLDLSMDMEADLGIDSIKRVEILGTVQDELPSLPELDAATLAECRTLEDIVAYMQSVAGTTAPAAEAAPAVHAAQAPVSATASGDITAVMLKVVADKTGYPAEMLDLAMDMEADLGIDSIKRVEILGTVQDELPSLPELDAATLAECRTLADIVAYMHSMTGAAQAPVSQAPALGSNQTAHSSRDITAVMLKVVADKTGYPAEMLELAMDMEADLGIDSIKRVEILGTVQDALPDLPEIDPSTLAECRTLGDIIACYSQDGAKETSIDSKVKAEQTAADADTGTEVEVDIAVSALAAAREIAAIASDAAPAVHAAAAPATLPAPRPQQVLDTMLTVVAEKTGYPVEMLDLAMDMEADLGIDSIKRVEILGTVQERLPGLAEVDAATLAECRTLGQIVESFSLPNQFVGTDASADTELAPHTGVALKKLPAADRLEAASAAALFAANGRVIILDDGHNAGVLAGRLDAKGLAVTVVRSDSLGHQSVLDASIDARTLSQQGDMDTEIQSLLKELEPVSAFIHLQPVMAADEGAADGKAVARFSDEAFSQVSLAFLFAKHLAADFAANGAHRRAFITAARMDGKLGLSGADVELNQGALFGLTKTLAQEWPHAHCRALDVAVQLDATALADAVIDALYGADDLLEWGIAADGRFAALATDAQQISATTTLNSTDKILVTGGAKGVTLDCALALAARTQAHFILAGRSKALCLNEFPVWARGVAATELKQAAIQELLAGGKRPTPREVDALIAPLASALEIQQALQAFSDLGASAEYLSMDVSSAESIAKALGPIQALAPVTGLIHGAGVLADKFIQDKTLDELKRVAGTKVEGLKGLLANLDELKLVALFSSAAGFYGNKGQSDYAMANEILNKAAHRLAHARPDCRVVAFDWGPWDGGMVTDSLKKMFQERGVYVIPRPLGAALFAEAVLGRAESQILVGSSMQGNADQAGADLKKPDGHSGITLGRTLRRQQLAILEDHQIGGNAVLPTVCALEWMQAAATRHFGGQWQPHDYRLLKGVVFDSDEKALTMVLSVTDTGLSALISCDGRPQYEARLEAPSPLSLPAEALAADIGQSAEKPVATGEQLYLDGALFHGPALQMMGDVSWFDENGLACSVTLPANTLSTNAEPGQAAIVQQDALLQALLVWARLKYDAASLPASLGRAVQHLELAPGELGQLRLWVKSHSSRQLCADVALYNAQGQLASAMEGVKVTISKSLNQAFLSAKGQEI